MKMKDPGRVLLPIVTAFDDNLEVDYERTACHAESMIDLGYGDSIIVTGTTGEFFSLTFEERIGLFKAIKKRLGDKAPMIAGTGSSSTTEAIAITKEAEKIGVDMAMVVTPYYCKADQEGIYQHYKAVAESTSLPVMLYNIPLFSGVNIEPETAGRLAEIENIVAIKEEAGINPTQSSRYVLNTPDDFKLYVGDDTMVLPVLVQGGVGVVSGGSQVVGQSMKKMIDLFFDGKVSEAIELHFEIFQFFEGLYINGRINPIPMLKAALALCGFDMGDPRPPLTKATSEEREHIKGILKKLHII